MREVVRALREGRQRRRRWEVEGEEKVIPLLRRLREAMRGDGR